MKNILHSKITFLILWLFFSIRMITDRNDPNPRLIDTPTTPMGMDAVMWFIGFYALFLLVFVLILNSSFSKQHPKTAYLVLSLWVLVWMFIGMFIEPRPLQTPYLWRISSRCASLTLENSSLFPARYAMLSL